MRRHHPGRPPRSAHAGQRRRHQRGPPGRRRHRPPHLFEADAVACSRPGTVSCCPCRSGAAWRCGGRPSRCRATPTPKPWKRSAAASKTASTPSPRRPTGCAVTAPWPRPRWPRGRRNDARSLPHGNHRRGAAHPPLPGAPQKRRQGGPGALRRNASARPGSPARGAGWYGHTRPALANPSRSCPSSGGFWKTDRSCTHWSPRAPSPRPVLWLNACRWAPSISTCQLTASPTCGVSSITGGPIWCCGRSPSSGPIWSARRRHGACPWCSSTGASRPPLSLAGGGPRG